MMNVFVKPNEQNRACSRYAMARKGRMKSNVCNLWKSTVLLLGLSSMLPTVVSCDASEDAVATSSVATEKQRLQVNFKIQMHGNGNSIDKDKTDFEDLVENLTINTIGEANSLNNNGAQGVANWEFSGTLGTANEMWSFVANLHNDDKQRIKTAGTTSGVEMETSKYLRGYGGLSPQLPILMVANVPNSRFEAANQNRVRTFSASVPLWRAFSRFSFQTYPLPNGYIIKRVSVERIPGKFMLVGHTGSPYKQLNASNANNYPYINGYVLWQSSSAAAAKQALASWQNSRWQASGTPNPDMYLSGQFYLPPCKVNNSVDPFGKSTDGGMPFMRFVFTDNQGNTFVRLYRLGNSKTDSPGNIDSNKIYNIRINLLVPSVVRDASLSSFDDGRNKAEFVN